MALDIPEASPENIVAVVDFVVMQPGVDASACASFADISIDHARRALEAAVLLGLVARDNGGYTSTGWSTDLLARGSLDQKRQIFRVHLERLEPFAHVRSRVLQGFDVLHACREARVLHDLEPTPAVIRDVFLRWGGFARTFVGDPPTIDTSLGIDSPLAGVIDPISDAGATAEEYLSDALTPALYVGLERGVRDNLVLAVRRLIEREEPRALGQPLGIAFEDFLRGVAAAHAIDVSTKNGIIEVGVHLRSSGKISKKHLGLVQAVGSMRTAIEHGIDNDEGKEWQMTAQGMRLYVSLVVVTLKSIATYNARTDLEM